MELYTAAPSCPTSFLLFCPAAVCLYGQLTLPSTHLTPLLGSTLLSHTAPHLKGLFLAVWAKQANFLRKSLVSHCPPAKDQSCLSGIMSVQGNTILVLAGIHTAATDMDTQSEVRDTRWLYARANLLDNAREHSFE